MQIALSVFHVVTNMHTPESDGTAQSVQSQGGLTTQPANFYKGSVLRVKIGDFVSNDVPEYVFTNSALFLKKLEKSVISQSPYFSLA